MEVRGHHLHPITLLHSSLIFVSSTHPLTMSPLLRFLCCGLLRGSEGSFEGTSYDGNATLRQAAAIGLHGDIAHSGRFEEQSVRTVRDTRATDIPTVSSSEKKLEPNRRPPSMCLERPDCGANERKRLPVFTYASALAPSEPFSTRLSACSDMRFQHDSTPFEVPHPVDIGPPT
ncbi:hypothetical protein BV20DRAFT_669685 [Pilatotrama ljubarskyi]|nr:hypothetical protein BV20DRAFT_669685 [Pilatotrama ljubarskyi]